MRLSAKTYIGIALTVLLTEAVPARAQYVLFARPTDTIQASGQTVIDTVSTYEAQIIVTSTYGTNGVLFNEWTSGAEDKALHAGPSYLAGYNFRVHPSLLPIESTPTVSLNTPHHVAYVYDGVEERLYLDGQLQASRAASGNVGDGSGLARVGYSGRPIDGLPRGFVGYVDSIRISNNARYSGTSFTPPLPGNLSADSVTYLLYNFDEAPGSTTAVDSSGLGRTGTLGVGFAGATSPVFVSAVPEPSSLALGAVAVVTGAWRWRRRAAR